MVQYLFQPEKILDCRSGIPQILSNIEICNSVANILATTLGPYGLDKLFYGKKLLVTNDGATILESMSFKHPVAKMLASLSKSQDNEVGDGTTSVVLLTSAILASLQPLISEGIPLDIISRVLQSVQIHCIDRLESLKIDFTPTNLKRLAETSLNSKNVRREKAYFADLLVNALSRDSEMHIEKVSGGSLTDSGIVQGIAFKKTFTYAGYEQQPKRIVKPKICCLTVELEWKSERANAELKIESVEEYQKMVDAEWKLINDKLKEIVDSGANIVLSSASIGDYATQYFARNGIFSAGRVQCLPRIVKAFGGKIASTTKYMQLGMCDLFEERQLGDARYNYLEGVNTRASTLILRGPGHEILEEIERSIHDAVCVIQTALKTENIVCGGGSVEMELSRLCRDLSFKCDPREMFVFKALSMAFEKIPSQLASNFGLDPVNVLQTLRQEHCSKVDVGVCLKGVDSMLELGIMEPMEVKKNMIKAAFNASKVILSIDSTIISKK